MKMIRLLALIVTVSLVTLVCSHDEESYEVDWRVDKREACDLAETQVDPKFQRRIVDEHNKLRAQEPNAAGMFALKWDNTLAERAQAWANYLAAASVLEHGYYDLCNETSIGQNLWYGSKYSDPENAVSDWHSEIEYFSYNTNSCEDDKVCGHYTTIIWGNTYLIGCGYSVGSSGKKYLVCNYYPPGNFEGQLPYRRGKPSIESCQQALEASPPAPGYGVTLDSSKFCAICKGGSKGCACFGCVHGTMNSKTCTCECDDGYSGNTCDVSCRDSSPYCDQWSQYCSNEDYRSFMQANCPCYCADRGASGYQCC